MNVIYSDSRNALSKMQNQYDAETNHSQNLEKQLEKLVHLVLYHHKASCIQFQEQVKQVSIKE